MKFSGTTYRAHNPEWAWDPMSGEGAALHGGRFNPVGQAALYMSLDPTTAIVEASPLGRPFQPLTLCSYQVTCDKIFDTTDPRELETEGLDIADADCPDWQFQMLGGLVPSSHRLALRLIELNYSGILIKSFAVGAASKAYNLILWKWNEDETSSVDVIDENQRLPKDRSSWS